MKLFRILTIIAVLVCVVAASVFAAPSQVSPDDAQQQTGDTLRKDMKDLKGKGFRCKDGSMMHKDPVEALKQKKEKVQSLLKEGKITKEQADAIIAKIDAKIKAIEEFNKHSPQQKKEKLLERFKASVEKKVKEGKLTREKADELIRKFSEKLKNWDGTGYPDFLRRGPRSGLKQRMKDKAL